MLDDMKIVPTSHGLLEHRHAHLFTYLWLLLHYNGSVAQLQETEWPQSLQYLLSGPFKKKNPKKQKNLVSSQSKMLNELKMLNKNISKK